jgi:hypothetical protein
MTEDPKLTELKMISQLWAPLYQSIYEKMGFVEGNEARTSATATVFISTKDEWKSAEYERKQEARKHPTQTPAAPSTPTSEFKTALELSKEEPAKPAPEAPKTDEPSTNMFGTDRWGKAWPTSLVCLNLVPTKEDSKRFELCGGIAKVHRSTKTNDIFAICPKCNIFLKHDGKPGKPAKPQE